MSKTRGKREAIPPGVAARTGGKRVAPVRPHPFGAGEAILVFLCGALLLLILAAAVVPRLIGCTPYAISSESMSPTLHRGDLVFVRAVTFDALEGNEIVVFRTDTGLITHRVYDVDDVGRVLRTKADASPYLDAYPISEGELVGRVVYKLPLLGYISLSLGGEEAGT